MSDASAGAPGLEERLGLVLRGVQRMADRFGDIEQQLADLASNDRLKALAERTDEYRARSRAEVGQITEVVTALAQAVDVVLREQQGLLDAVRNPTAPKVAGASHEAVERLTDAVRGLRDDLAESHRVLREETHAAVERVAGEQAERAMRLLEAVGESSQRTVAGVLDGVQQGDEVAALAADLRHLRTTLDGRQVVLTEAIGALRGEISTLAEQVAALPTEAPPPPPPPDDTAIRTLLGELRDDFRRLEGELEAASGQLRTEVGARLAELGTGGPTATAAPADLKGIFDRLGGIEWRLGERLDPLDQRLAALEQRIESLGSRPSTVPDHRIADRLAALEAGLEQVAQRDDLRRGVDRVLGAVSGSEQAVTGELRAVDARVGALADDVRMVRVLRDGLDALTEGIDGVRQLAARTATSQQMSEVTRELGSVLAEIDSARNHVLRVEQSSGPMAADVVAVGTEVDDLGKRIDQLAGVIEERLAGGNAAEVVAERLRQVSASARQLGNGVLEDLRVRRGRRR